MGVSTRVKGNRMVLSPRESLVAGGPAGELEKSVQQLYRSGYRHIVVDLGEVPTMDSAGVRAMVRCLTTGRRLGGSFALASPSPAVRGVLESAHLGSVFPIFDSIESATVRRLPWKPLRLALAGLLLVAALVGVGTWQDRPAAPGGTFPPQETASAGLGAAHRPFFEVLKLVAAAAIGGLVTAVRRWQRRLRHQTRSMEQAQILLCVAGAMMMIIIGDSIARAFGIAGAAAIIRFRTPVEDPEDITVLFLLMGLGMSTGLGAFAVAGLATAFLCVLLLALDRIGARRSRAMVVEIEAGGREFPGAHVQGVFARHGIVFEPREVSHGKSVAVRYLVTLEANQSLEELSESLVAGGTAGVQAVSWEAPRKSEL